MERGVTGQLRLSRVLGESVQAFVPAPLPPDPPLHWTGERWKLLERAALAIGRLDSMASLLPSPEIFLYAYVRREAVLSSQIEGTQSSLAQLLMYEVQQAPGVPVDDVVQVSNYVAALEHGIRRLREGFPLSNRLIREMHAILLSHGRGSDRSPGEYRRTQNWIGGTRPGNAHFVPPPAEHVNECMAQLETFLHDRSTSYPSLIKAALAHAQFETIHPFLDGNGRIGRLLIAFVLHHDHVLSQPLLYLSLYFKQNRSEYYSLLDRVRWQGDWEAWVDFFLEGIDQVAMNAVTTAERLLSLFVRDEESIRSGARLRSTTLHIFRAFCRRPITDIKTLSKMSGLSFPAVSSAVRSLENLGIVREITGRKRNRIFTYQEYLDILNEGT